MGSPQPHRLAARLAGVLRRVLAEVQFCRRVLAHPRTPRAARVCLGAALLYLASPIDLIPDFIPVLGHLDDVVIVGGLLWIGLRLIPGPVRAECRAAVPVG